MIIYITLSFRQTVFEVTLLGLNFLSVVLSRRSSRLKNDVRPASERTSARGIRVSDVVHRHHVTSSKSVMSSDPGTSALLFFDNPIPLALESTLVRDGIQSISSSIAVSLAKLVESFSQPTVSLGGSLISHVTAEADGGAISGSPLVFGHLLSHRQAVHTALRLLLASSPKAKHAVIEGSF